MGPEEFKAVGFSSGLPVWRELLGEHDWERTIPELPEATRALMETPPLAASWIPAEAAYGFSYTVARLFPTRGLQLIEDHGRLCVERDVKGIYKPLLRVLTVDFAMSRAASLYQRYSRNAGSLSVDRVAPRQAVCHYADQARVDNVRAALLGGSALGVLSVIGVGNARVAQRTLGSRHIDIRLEW